MTTHLIGKTNLHLRLQGQEDPFRRQQEAGRMFWEKAVPALEKIFDEIVGKEELVRIDQLEIKLHFERWENFQDDFVKAVSNALKEKLEKMNRSPVAGLVKIPLREALFSSWLYYLEKGIVPPATAIPEEKEWQAAILENLGMHTAAVNQLSALLKSSPLAFERLLLQYPVLFFRSLAELYTGKKQAGLTAVSKELSKILNVFLEIIKKEKKWKIKPEFRQNPEKFFWRKTFETTIVQRQKKEWQELAAEALVQVFSPVIKIRDLVFSVNNHEEDSKIKLTSFFEVIDYYEKIIRKKELKNISDPDEITDKKIKQEKKSSAIKEDELNQEAIKKEKEKISEPSISELKKEHQEKISEKEKLESGKSEEVGLENKITKKGKKEEQKKSADFNEGIAGTTDKEGIELKKEELEKDWEKLASEDKLDGWQYIPNAGIVLLHPFLKRFFTALKLVKENEFIDKSAQQRAVHLLQYLATGETGLPEYELLLPKLLCGIPFAIPIEQGIKLKNTEKKEATNLLNAVIENWGVLGTTSPDGLREGFFQRDGKLQYKNNNWYLEVEKKAIDVLLTKLPWGIGMIKLPWMPDLLRVDWG